MSCHFMSLLVLKHVKSSQEILPGKSDHFRVVKCPNPMAVAQVLFTNMVASFSTLESQALAPNQSGQSGPPKCWQHNCAKKKETTNTATPLCRLPSLRSRPDVRPLLAGHIRDR